MPDEDIVRQFDVDVSIKARHFDFGPDAYRFNAKVTQILDADTFGLVIDQGFFDLKRLEGRARMRLIGIDTPEKETDAGRQAIGFVEGLVEDAEHRAVVKTVDQGHYARWLGVMWLNDGTDLTLQQRLVEQGHYKTDDRYAVQPEAIPPEFLDVNEASAFQLAWLPGVGGDLAQDIVRQRPFGSLEELPAKVDGIGPATLEKTRGYLQDVT